MVLILADTIWRILAVMVKIKFWEYLQIFYLDDPLRFIAVSIPTQPQVFSDTGYRICRDNKYLYFAHT
ncbi:MAG: hypothetical protein EBY35_08000 [Rhodobacteraceae bacterium]|nr:hypothetical protein [Paracoccaceae bacterium]